MKTKGRLLASFICLLTVVFVVFGLASCKKDDEACSHQWGEWTVTANATCVAEGAKERKCSACGETESSAIPATGHDWSAATCQTPKTCKNCSATEGAVGAHSYVVETVKTETLKSAATCTSGAVYYKSCACGAISTSDADTFVSGSPIAHKDDNTDHVCDYECGKTDVGTHADAAGDGNHLCDYGCGATIGTCSDAAGDDDHKCDECDADNVSTHDWADATCQAPKTCSECGATEGGVASHKDDNTDHVCDYGCGKTDMGSHADAAGDGNHLCDYGCGDTIGACSDAAGDDDHKCDECDADNVTTHDWADATCQAPKTCTECGATDGEAANHKDEDHDHACDYECGKTDVGAHADAAGDGDHLCDYGCGATIGTCSDAAGDGNHKCDECGAATGECSDAAGDGNHKCDECGAATGACFDAEDDGDHKCDECDADNVTTHDWADATCQAPKTCTECGETEGAPLEHKDENRDHKCDNDCGKTDIGGVHGDSPNDGDHWCDYCGNIAEACYDEDGDRDHNCDICGKRNISKHNWGDATCGSPATCIECEEESGEPLDHKDDDHDHACDYGCGKTDMGDHEDAAGDGDHLCDYGCGATIGACSDAEGDDDHKCDECDAENVTTHDWADATCQAPKTCTECGQTEGTAVDHKDDDTNHVCDFECGKDDIGTCSDSMLDSDHICDYGCGKALESCTDKANDGNHKCDICGADNVTAHSWTDATCSAPKTCSECGATDGDVAECKDENNDHACDYGCGKTDMGTHEDSAEDTDHVCDYGCGAVLESCTDKTGDGDHKCDVCGNADITEHSWTDATCSAPKTCSECGATTGASLEHKDENFDHKCDNDCGKTDMGNHADDPADKDHICDYGCNAVLETCFDSESDADHKCDVCEAEAVSAHKYVETAHTPANCTAAAIYTYTCNCGDKYTENKGDAQGHNITGVTATEKLVDGCEYILVYKCKTCGAEVEGKTVYNHNYIASISTPATCTADGQKTFKCSECGDEGKAPETIPADATGHKWVEGSAQSGTRTDTCSVCSATKTVTVYDGTKTGEVDAGDLKDKEIELNDANISLDNGVIDTIGDQKVTVSAEKLEGDDRIDLGLGDKLAQVGDNPIYNFTIESGSGNIANFGENNWVTITLPYELDDGEDVDSIAIWFINDLGELESIEATYNNGYVTFKTNHFSYYTVTKLNAEERCALYGHSYTKQHVDGNCTKDEYDLYVCVRCHDKYIDEETLIVADGHDYTSVTTDPTCLTAGYVTYTCADCGHIYKTKANALGHNFEIVDHEDASCAKDGYTTYGCTRCDAEYTEVIAKLPHSYTVTVHPATCTADGYTLCDCDNCEYFYTHKYVEALGHDYEAAGWTWAADYSSATLTFVCANDENHVITESAAVETNVINGTCSNFVKTTYTAKVTYGGAEFTDEKSIEVGNPDHAFSDSWYSDESGHWRQCVCGERGHAGEHVFENTAVIKAPTCAEAGESVSYCVCGEIHAFVVPATGEHNYDDNGICTECGAVFVDNYYLNLVNSWKNITGFSVKIRDLSFELKEKYTTLAETFRLEGSIRQIDIIELMLYVEDGDIYGAACGSVVIYNGPISGVDAVCSFKAVIHDGYVYIMAEYGNEGAEPQTAGMRISVDSIIAAMMDSMLGEMEMDSSVLGFVGMIADTFVPVIGSILDANADGANALFEDLFNIFFTFEEQEDGSVVATLDFDKLAALNENLADKPVSEVIDIYFGEGAFDALADFVRELLALKLSEVPEYLEQIGLDPEEIFDIINAFAVNMGAPEDFDIGAMLDSEDYAELTFGMLLFESEDDSYTELVESIISDLCEMSLYQLAAPDSADMIKDGVAGIIDMISESVTISFTTDNNGALTAISIAVNGFNYRDEEVDITFSIDVLIEVNGRINVTWADIIERVEALIVLPKDDMFDSDGYANIVYPEDDYKDDIIDTPFGDVSMSGIIGGQPYHDGWFTYGGEEYYYEMGLRVKAYKPLYDRMSGIMFSNDCAGWMQYQAIYDELVAEFTVAILLNDDGTSDTFIISHYSDTVAKLIQNDNSITAVFEDGTEKNFELDTSGVGGMDEAAILYAKIYYSVFGDEGAVSSLATGRTYYYNASLDSYALNTQHEYNEDYELAGDTCEDGCTVTVTCDKCDYYNRYVTDDCSSKYAEVDLSEHGGCASRIPVYRCSICDSITRVDIYNAEFGCSFGAESTQAITGANGEVIGYKHTTVCTVCGLIFVNEEWVEDIDSCSYYDYERMAIYKDGTAVFNYTNSVWAVNHDYRRYYEYGASCNGEQYTVTERCSRCGDEHSWKQSGHVTNQFAFNFGEHGGCGGYIEGSRCELCGEMTYLSESIWCELRYEFGDGVQGDDGYIHYVIDEVCERCGLRFVTDMWIEQRSVCVSVEHRNVKIYNGEELLFEYEVTYKNTNHQNQSVRYELIGADCKEGYYVISYCDVCGESERYIGFEHRYQYTDIDLQQHGLCGGHISESSCELCGYTARFDPNIRCTWEDQGVNQEGYTVSQCAKCGAVMLSKQYVSEKDEKCRYEYIDIFVLMKDGIKIYRREQSGMGEEHDWDYKYELMGPTCDSGGKVIQTCKDCGVHYYYGIYGHEEHTVFTLDGISGCCPGHNLEVRACPCGEIVYANFVDDGNLRYDDLTQSYICDECGLRVTDATFTNEDGCSATVSRVVSVTLGGAQLYFDSKESVTYNHSYDSYEVSEYNGRVTIYAVCTRCGESKASEMIEGELTSHEDGCYLDIAFSPDHSGRYVLKIFASQYLRVTVYKVLGGKLQECGYAEGGGSGSPFEAHTWENMTSGVDYIYRISSYDGCPVKVSYVLYEETKSGGCDHRYSLGFAALLPGSESCTDGAFSGSICRYCGYIYYERMLTDHETSTQMVQLNEHGACYGNLTCSSCACGEVKKVDVYSCALTYTSNEEYNDTYGAILYTEVWTCPSCGLRYTRAYYITADGCTRTYHYFIEVSIGATLIVADEYEASEVEHDFETSIELIGGAGSSCEDGIIVTHRCVICSHTETSEYNYHRTYEKDTINLSALGSTCGGYATVIGCACGRDTSISLEHSRCDRGNGYCERWIDNAVEGQQRTIEYEYDYYFDHNVWMIVCAVTDPACAFKIRRADYWLKGDGECYAYRYQTWQFGYDEETGEFEYELTFRTGEKRTCHAAAMNTADYQPNNYECPDCGSYYRETRVPDANGNTVSYVREVCNTLNDGNNRYFKYIEEYATDDYGRYCSREYREYINHVGDRFFSDNTKIRESYGAPFGDKAYRVISTSINEAGDESREEYAFTVFKGHEYQLYTYIQYSDGWWERYDYEYSFDGICLCTETITDMKGASRSNTYECCQTLYTGSLYPTCTQDGIDYHECRVCGRQSEEIVSPYDHEWVYLTDGYYCQRCGIENTNGVSGAIIMEDLTEAHGGGEYYVVGYYQTGSVEFTSYICIILSSGEEIVLDGVDIYFAEGIRGYMFSKSDVDAWASRNGYTDYLVKFVFSPYGGDGSFDYAVTFTEREEVDVVTDDIVFIDYIPEGDCLSYTIAPTVNAVWTFTSITNRDTYAELFDENGDLLTYNDDGVQGSNFLITYNLDAGKTYTIRVRYYGSGDAAGYVALGFVCEPIA